MTADDARGESRSVRGSAGNVGRLEDNSACGWAEGKSASVVCGGPPLEPGGECNKASGVASNDDRTDSIGGPRIHVDSGENDELEMRLRQKKVACLTG